MLDRVAQAARNNAEWCDAVARSWGESGVFEDTVWINRGAAPPLYPNAVTLAPIATPPAAIAAAPVDFAVKDSFATLDLAPLGFAPLFEATWIWRDPQPVSGSDAATWRILRDTASLSRWDTAWRGDDNGPSPFRPTLLYERDHAFIAGEEKGRIVAGCVASRSAAVVGISNLFGPPERSAGCLAAVQAFAPGLPIVGYETGAALEMMKTLGFQALAPLRVWLRDTG
ncbi:hypothetical protein [Dongia sedimenti]|uniref:N-acetyltransferase domain-containing protein n=1 Tax=Dongia sedimenti TaxID=3064282 RepID=A0ABU0YLB2_9PROT|nr:hypothetical protein [Rhodospirillaceae bacterium R-7]